MTKKLFALIIASSIITAHATELTTEPSVQPTEYHAPEQSLAVTAALTVLGGCQSLAQLVMASGAWKMLAADTYTNIRFKSTDLYLDSITTEHTYMGEMVQGAAAIVAGYLIYKASCLLETKIVPDESCCANQTYQEPSTEPANQANAQ
jgi:hypothetical protein